MMDCKEFSDLLDAFLEGKLTAEETEKMRAHAAECAECAALMALREDCRALEDETELPESFSASWRAAVRAEAEKGKRASSYSFRQSWMAAAAALVMIAGGVWTMSRGKLPAVGKPAGSAKAPAAVTAPDGDAGGLANLEETYGLSAAGALNNVMFEEGTMEIAMEDAEESVWDAAYEAEESALDAGGETTAQAPALWALGSVESAAEAREEYSAAAKAAARESKAEAPAPTAMPTPLPAASPAPAESPAPEKTEAPAEETEGRGSPAWRFWLGLAVCVTGIAVLVFTLARKLKKGRT